MSFAPRPSVSACQASASIAAGFRATSGTRVAVSQAAAPESIAGKSRPWSAAGRRPTAESSEVRPPTQSHIGKRSSQPPFAATSSSSLCAPVTATACFANSRPAFRYASAATSIPLRVSFVPPDFEITTVSVAGRPPSVAAIRESSRARPSGSVLSKKNGRSGSRGEPSASATNCGPSAEPPMPTTRRFVKCGARDGAIRPP